MKKIPMAMLAVALIAITVMERKKAKAVQERARRAMYPGDTQEMADVLAELRSSMFNADTVIFLPYPWRLTERRRFESNDGWPLWTVLELCPPVYCSEAPATLGAIHST